MSLKLDHIIHVVHNLDVAVATFRQLGFHVTAGGHHLSWGTQNALIYFDLTYIELVAVVDPRVAALSEFGSPVLLRARAGEGPETIAFATEQIEAEVLGFRARGVAIHDPRPGNRRRNDGSVVAWQMAMPSWPLPFLIQWDQGPEARRAELAARGATGPHRLGSSLGFRRVGWAVHNLGAIAEWMVHAYGITFGLPFTDRLLRARCVESPSGLMLCMPDGPGPVEDQLRAMGEGPFLYDLSGSEGPARLIPPAAAHGAWIRLEP